MNKWNNSKTDKLIKALLLLKTPDECKKFLRDLLTEEEIIEFGARFEAAELLYQKVPYSEINRTTGLSSTTIARVARWLNSGMNGYRTILNRLHHHPAFTLKRGLG